MEHCFVRNIGKRIEKRIETLKNETFCSTRVRTSTRVLPRVYFHTCASTRVLLHVYFHETYILHAMSKRGPRKHGTGMQCSTYSRGTTCDHACKNEVIVERYCI